MVLLLTMIRNLNPRISDFCQLPRPDTQAKLIPSKTQRQDGHLQPTPTPLPHWSNLPTPPSKPAKPLRFRRRKSTTSSSKEVHAVPVPPLFQVSSADPSRHRCVVCRPVLVHLVDRGYCVYC
jgi:hypothetical protein